MFSDRPSRFTSGEEPWFRVGGLDVGTSGVVAGIIALSMFMSAVEGRRGPIRQALRFDPNAVLDGEIWRLFTWWISNQPSLWRVLTVVYVFYFGSQLEGALGRKRMVTFFVYLIVVPAVLASLFTLVGLTAGSYLALTESGWLSLSLLFSFVAFLPHIRFFFGIPGWVLAAVIAVIDLLQFMSGRLIGDLFWYVVATAAVLLVAKAFGLAEQLSWIPRLPLPAATAGVAPSRPRRGPKRPVATLDDPFEEMEINAILDQVSEKGIQSLSRSQKRKLKAHGSKRRGRG